MSDQDRSEKFRSDIFEKLFFTDSSIKMTADIVDAIEKCLNFIIFEKKMKKNSRLRVCVTKRPKKQKNAFFRRRVK